MSLHNTFAVRIILYTGLTVFLYACTAPQKRAPVPGLAVPEGPSVTISVASLDPADSARVAGAKINLAGRTYTTNERGWVLVELDAGEYDVRVSHPDFAPAFPRIHISEGQNHKLIQLAPIAQHIIADAREEAVIESDGATIEVPKNAFAGSPRGPVRAEFAALDVTGPEIAAMPGDFTGQSAKGAEVMIESLGALSLSFYDESGNELQIAKGRSIDVRLPCHGEVNDETIPLWSFDEERSTWIEEGAATVVHAADGCHFEMKLPHLSWWNVDRPIEERSSIRIAGVLMPDGSGLAEPLITAEGIDYNGYSSAMGRRGKFASYDGPGFCIDVKPNSRIKLKIEYFQGVESDSGARYSIPWHQYETELRSGAGGNSCREDATGGVQLGTITLQSMGEKQFNRHLLATYGKLELLNLRDGSVVRGAVLDQYGDALLIDTGNRLRFLQTREVEYITYP